MKTPLVYKRQRKIEFLEDKVVDFKETPMPSLVLTKNDM